MRHRKSGWKLGRKGEHRQAMLRNMATSLFQHERIQTTAGRAKALRPYAERIISLAKRESLHARRLVSGHIADRAVVKKLFDTLSARYLDRHGGYTRILKLGPRFGDGAEMALVELVGSELKIDSKPKPKKGWRRGAKPKAEDAPGAPEPDAAEASGGTKKAGAKKAAAKAEKKRRGSTHKASGKEK
ncbi:MAG: 50S ribosomal protein L17 [Acidobacteria bacterium]|nr:50S ribosomal protein L17 [Acidobacteriota bacterium]